MKGGWKNWRGAQVTQHMRDGAREAVRDAGEAVLGASSMEVPHDEGTLQRSGMVVMNPDGGPEGCVTYGGGEGTGHPIVPYAVRWHENSANFQKGRKRFYLRDPVNRVGSKALNEAMAIRLGRRLK